MYVRPNIAVSLEVPFRTGECEQVAQQTAADLAQAAASIARREKLLMASAAASRMLLEASDAMRAMPAVLQVLGEAAGVDRTGLLLAQTGPAGEPLLVVSSEWVAEGVTPHLGDPVTGTCDVRKYPVHCSELLAGRSVCIYKEPAIEEEHCDSHACSNSLEGFGTKSKAIVPIFLDGQFIGVVGFDNTRQRRAIDAAELAVLETAAGVIGAALHRERLVDAVRREREHAAEERLAALMERNRVGQEIHDGLAQAFTGILMQLGAAEESEGFAKHPSLSVVFNRIRDIAREGLAEARRSVLAMRPEQARRGGLALALRQLADRSTVTNRVDCSFEGSEQVTGLAPEHEHELLRIAQEAVSNAVRHAQPRTVRITMNEDAGHWVLAVVDDGCGMESIPDLSAQQGFGLTNMRDRATAIGGEWLFDTRPNIGTRVSVRVPNRKAA